MVTVATSQITFFFFLRKLNSLSHKINNARDFYVGENYEKSTAYENRLNNCRIK